MYQSQIMTSDRLHNINYPILEYVIYNVENKYNNIVSTIDIK